MQELFENSAKAVENVSLRYIREYISLFDQPDRLIGIKGSRGVGKTTLLLQYIKTRLKGKKYVYISLDDFYFSENTLLEFTDSFVKNGGNNLIIDEVHHYKDWAKELKIIYDRYPALKVIFTGSSMLQLHQSRSDLSRRMVLHTINGLSLREFINITEKKSFSVISFDEIIYNHIEKSKEIWKVIKPIEKYNDYLRYGYYPFFLENINTYTIKLMETIQLVLEADLPYVALINYNNIEKIRQLLYIISASVPFKPNILKLCERTGLSRNSIKQYFHFLSEAKIIGSLRNNQQSLSILTKPEKIYLHHPNIMYAVTAKVNEGTLRETFFYNQVGNVLPIHTTPKGDFLINEKYIVEVGGRTKSHHQLSEVKNSFYALDGIESGYKKDIPLWLFGFLY